MRRKHLTTRTWRMIDTRVAILLQDIAGRLTARRIDNSLTETAQVESKPRIKLAAASLKGQVFYTFALDFGASGQHGPRGSQDLSQAQAPVEGKQSRTHLVYRGCVCRVYLVEHLVQTRYDSKILLSYEAPCQSIEIISRC